MYNLEMRTPSQSSSPSFSFTVFGVCVPSWARFRWSFSHLIALHIIDKPKKKLNLTLRRPFSQRECEIVTRYIGEKDWLLKKKVPYNLTRTWFAFLERNMVIHSKFLRHLKIFMTHRETLESFTPAPASNLRIAPLFNYFRDRCLS